MSTALTAIKENQYTPEQMKLITDVVAKGATKDELQLFLYRCQNLGLDPLKPGQIYFIKYGTSPGTIVVGIEGFRARAAKTGKLSGIKRGALRDDKGALVGAFAEVYRSDWKEPAREEVPLAEYNTGKGNWTKMPETMIKKVAEAAALRMAFPDDLGGVYTREEMEQAEGDKSRGFDLAGNGNSSPKPGYIYYSYHTGKHPSQVEREIGRGGLVEEKDRLALINNADAQQAYHVIDEYLRLSDGAPVEPDPSEGGMAGFYVVPFGRKFKDKMLKDIPQEEIDSYLQWLKADAEKKGQPLSAQVVELQRAYDEFYGEMA